MRSTKIIDEGLNQMCEIKVTTKSNTVFVCGTLETSSVSKLVLTLWPSGKIFYNV